MANTFLKRNNSVGQSILEVMITFVLVSTFLAGIMHIWIWGNNQIVKRQIRYNQTRVAAGNATDDYKLNDEKNKHPWPVYEPDKLGEDKVLHHETTLRKEG